MKQADIIALNKFPQMSVIPVLIIQLCFIVVTLFERVLFNFRHIVRGPQGRRTSHLHQNSIFQRHSGGADP